MFVCDKNAKVIVEKEVLLCYTMHRLTTMIENREAKFNYFIEDTIEAGLVLVGSEVKSIRQGNMSLKDCFIKISNGEVFLYNSHIATYDKTSAFVPDQRRTRKLLLHKSQIEKLEKRTSVQGYSLVPLKVYFSRGKAKLLVGIGKGKKLYDKRASIKERDNLRQAKRDIKAM